MDSMVARLASVGAVDSEDEPPLLPNGGRFLRTSRLGCFVCVCCCGKLGCVRSELDENVETQLGLCFFLSS